MTTSGRNAADVCQSADVEEWDLALRSTDWGVALESELAKPYWAKLGEYVRQQRLEHGGRVYPSAHQVFAALS